MYKELFQLAKKEGLEQFQILETSIENLSIQTFNDKIEKFETSNIVEYLVNAIYEEKEVSIHTELLNEEIIECLKEQAKYLEIKNLPTKKLLEDIKEEASYQINSPSITANRLNNLEKLKKEYPTLKEINTDYEESIIQRRIITENNELYDIKKERVFFVEVMVQENEINSTFYNSKQNIEDKDIDVETLTKEVIENAIDKLHYQPIQSGIYQVILTSKVMGSILNKFIDLFSADSLQKDTSLLVGKQNKQVFSSKVSIIEDPWNKTLIGKRLFDNKGTKTYYKEIVKNGVFQQALYDERTAIIDNVNTTGNDYGEISVRNLYIKKGEKSLDELISSLEKGILIDSVVGLHAGINPINGDISLQSEGYYIENGKKKYATKLFVLSTNIMDILNNVIELSNQVECHLKTTSSPDILLKNITISK